MPTMSEEVEKQVLEDFRKRARLGSNSLPSVSFYSFINTHNSLNCAAISGDGALVAGGFSDSSVKVWDMAKLGKQNTIEKPSSNGFTETRETALEGSKSSYSLLQGHAGPVYAASFSPDSDFLLTSSADCTVRLWSMKLKTNLMGYKGHNFPVWDVQYSPVGHYFATASHDRTARVWCMERMQPLRILVGHMSDVDCLQWHVNCNYIATGGTDNTVRLWDVQTGECLRVFNGHCGTVLSLAMSSDGRYMASGDDRGAIFMWDLGSGQCVAPLMGHTSCVWTLAFSGEGSLLASGSADNTVRLWDVNATSKGSRAESDKGSATRHLRLLKTLPTKATPVYALKFSRTNLLLAAGAFSPSQASKAAS
jgi:transcription initiation factor TFIID subunit 5